LQTRYYFINHCPVKKGGYFNKFTAKKWQLLLKQTQCLMAKHGSNVLSHSSKRFVLCPQDVTEIPQKIHTS
jgi:hypothetical protein